MKSYSSAAFLLCASLGLSAQASLDDLLGGENPQVISQVHNLLTLNPFSDYSSFMDHGTYIGIIFEQARESCGMYAGAGAPVAAATVSPSTAIASAADRGSPRSAPSFSSPRSAVDGFERDERLVDHLRRLTAQAFEKNKAALLTSLYGVGIALTADHSLEDVQTAIGSLDPLTQESILEPIMALAKEDVPLSVQIQGAITSVYSARKKHHLSSILPSIAGLEEILSSEDVGQNYLATRPSTPEQRTFLQGLQAILRGETPVAAAAAPGPMHGGGAGGSGHGAGAGGPSAATPPTDRTHEPDLIDQGRYYIGAIASNVSGGRMKLGADLSREKIKQFLGMYGIECSALAPLVDTLKTAAVTSGARAGAGAPATAAHVPLWEDPTPAVRHAILTSSDRTLLRDLHAAIAALHTEVEAKDGMDVHEANRGVLAPHSGALLDLMARASTTIPYASDAELEEIVSYAAYAAHPNQAEIKQIIENAPSGGTSGELGGDSQTVLVQAWVLAQRGDEIEGNHRFKNALLNSIAQNITTGGGCTDGVVGRALIFSAECLHFLMDNDQL